MPVRLVIRHYPNPSARTYAVNREISNYPQERFIYPLGEAREEQSEFSGWNHLGKVGRSLVKKVLQIKGVREIFITPYEINVFIAEAFLFDEIEPFVLDALREVLNEGELEIETRTR